jgi:ribosomal protein S12
MTQISRKLFNKSPFVRNDSGSLCRAGGEPEGHAAKSCLVKQGICMRVFQMAFRKPSRSLRGRVRQHRCSSFLQIMIEL